MALNVDAGQARSEINMTPLIDVLLVLLVIFMVVTPLLTKALESEIPRRADEVVPAQSTARQLVLQLTADGRYVLNREELSITSLSAKLRELFAQPGGRKVIFLDADDSLPYGTVIQALDLCRSAGAEHVGIVTEAVSAPGVG